MPSLNLGVLAHVDAGKTSLTERLLHTAGAIPVLGAVDDGTTQTDAMDLERRRGITIRSAVATFTRAGHRINLIDTPGHADFVAEVERALGVLDGAVLVLSAVEGVQAQTRVLLRTLRALRVPTVLFANKIDRTGARSGALLAEIRAALTPSAIAVNTFSGTGARATVRPRTGPEFTEELTELLAEHDDTVLADWLNHPETLSPQRLRGRLGALSRTGTVHPVLFGSAATGAGVAELLDAIPEFLPAATGSPAEPLSGTVFAVERDPGGTRTAVVRLFTGTLSTRDTVPVEPGHRTAKITALHPGPVTAGDIARLTTPAALRIGDHLGDGPPANRAPRLRPPTLEAEVRADDPGALFAALTALADQDPLIDVRRAAEPGALVVTLYGEVQREVLAARLAEEHGVTARFSAPRVVCVERLCGNGSAVEEQAPGEDRFWATIGLRVEPAPPGAGVTFTLAVERGILPRAYLTAIEATVRDTLREGPSGWAVPDCAVTLTDAGYCAPLSTAADFRGLTPIVLLTALRRAGTTVCEPVEHVELTVPPTSIHAVLTELARHRARPEPPVPHGDRCTITATVPSAALPALDRALPALTGGTAVLQSHFHGHTPTPTPHPTRPRTTHPRPTTS